MRQLPNTRSNGVNGRPRIISRTLPSPYRIQVIDRASLILDAFSFEEAELSVRQLSLKTGLHKGTVHRILRSLHENGLIQQDAATGDYHLGLKLFRLGHQAISRLDLRRVARPHIARLMRETRETVHLAALDDDRVLYLEKVEGPHALRMPSRVGRRIPAFCTSLGKAMLSCLEEGEVTQLLRRCPIQPYTPNTVSSLEDLLADLDLTRRRGYSVDREEIEIGLRCVGAPLRNYSRCMVGAISVAGPSARITPEKVPALGKLVVKAASAISHELGYQQGPSVLETSKRRGWNIARTR